MRRHSHIQYAMHLNGDSARGWVQVKSGASWRVKWEADSIMVTKDFREESTRVRRESYGVVGRKYKCTVYSIITPGCGFESHRWS